jgi:hypothetical protein
MEGDSRKHGKRSPSFPLSVAREFLERVYKALGTGPFDRGTFAKALGHEALSGPSSTKIASLVHFGLLQKARDGYALSPLAERLLAPVSETEKRQALAEAAQKPAIYALLFERYRNQPLPHLLPNVLVRDYGIEQKQAARAAENFRQTAEYAGLLRSGVLYVEIENGAASEPGSTPAGTGASTGAIPAGEERDEPARPDERSGTGYQPAPRPGYPPVPLPGRLAAADGIRNFDIPLNASATRVAWLQIPAPIQKTDLERIKKWIYFIEQSLEEAPEDEGEK